MSDSIADHSWHSSLREKVVEHLFVGQLLRTFWQLGLRDFEVLRADVDNAGYDLAIEQGGVIRHIQLKSSCLASFTSRQNVHLALADKASGCVIWIRFEPETLELGPFLWFGAPPGERLPNLNGMPVARHSKGDANGLKKERPNLRVIRKDCFKELEDIDQVAAALFGVTRPNEHGRIVDLVRQPNGLALAKGARNIRSASEELILRRPGLPYLDILKQIREEFPDCKTSVGCLRWYASQLRDRGEPVPERPRN